MGGRNIGEKEECFKTSPFEVINDDDDDDDDEVSDEEEGSCTVKLDNGGSSSNSTVEESEKNKPSVRPYVRSKMPRLRWTPDLHLRFMHAVERLGGQERATPKLVLQFMGIKGLNISHVKSHLQMYRSKRIDESNQGMKDQRFFMEGVDRNIYNLSQLPLLPTFNQRPQNSNISFPRNGDAATWDGHGKWMQNSSIAQNINNKTIKPGFYGTINNNLDSHYYKYNRSSANNINLDLFSKTSPFFERSTWRTNNEGVPKQDEYRSLYKQEPLLGQSTQNPSVNINPPIIVSQIMRETGLKRKASDFEVDLNLSLAVESRNDEDGYEELGLSLYTSASSKKIYNKKVKEDVVSVVVGNENARGASTLDLTL
ncbi:hypothetical protein ABFS82_10G012300 [Erythranthe guttata]|uniref:HTH myb-type domain-containing protein n=1 Tax=Erythranthe guttata TaxID=4155 RepID=A0A022RQB0_ERYGU|nr:PREDICTED: uncharacterized protein LOC105952810 [Erythranthe guttata]EYU41938.1 hypothetical protein MIMGU_mgv1a020265mg [Erythranthe guttata]|eukprot:XP_012831843.1 PREDICTED: uncharacterized protein LOC105952810 [Erythranthe guttata]